ncbi:uncharacterized protein LOC135336892 [Halichondria panicea]|uniref:uncharacterized protein LOC135336892 n=1 Tax=Halichondria panicea TaxID=6063 RepID=UPI00312B70D6
MYSWLLLVLSLLAVSSANQYHIVSVNCTDLCHDYQSFTLEQLVQTDLLSGADNLILRFLPGDHVLNEQLLIGDFIEVLIIGNDATIKFKGTGSLQLSNISKLSIEGLYFTGASDENISVLQNVLITKCYLVYLRLLELEACRLRINRTVAVTIEQVLFVNNTDTHRALIVEADNVYIEKSVFFSNNGGAVYIDSDITIINGSSFYSNTAASGGAVDMVSANVTISFCNFTDNRASQFGGAISVYTGRGSVSFYNCKLLNNIAEYGGEIYAYKGSVSVHSCDQTINIADTYGGAIYAYTGSVFIKNCDLSKNNAKYGAAIYASVGSLIIYNSELTDNIADCNGGAIYGKTSVSIYNSELTNNSAHSGGAIFAYTGSVSIYNTELSNNNAATKGGAVDASSVDVNISFSNITNNSASQDGGAIYADSGSVSFYSCDLTSNSADIHGGLIYDIRGNVSIYNCDLTNNSAEYGGAIYNNAGSVLISSCELAYNNAKRSGGVSFVFLGDLVISYSNLTNNKAILGGAITIFKSKCSISNCILLDNEAVIGSGQAVTSTSIGGAVLVHDGSISVFKSILTNNSADYGGAIVSLESNVIISDSVFTKNSATQQGGVIAVAISTLIITNVKMIDNLEGEDIIYAVHSNLSFMGVNNVSNNTNPVHAQSSRVEFNGPTTLSNNRGVQGGAIRAVQSQIYINAEGVVITNNTAMSGGGVFLKESAFLVRHPIEISHNTAQNGGGIYAYASEIEFDPRHTIGCERDNQQILCTCSDIIKLPESIIDQNKAQNGGGIYAVASNIDVFSHTYVHIKSNSANSNGGGFYLQQNSKIYILKKEVEFERGKTLVELVIFNNTAQYGGGIFVADSTDSGACRGKNGTAGEVTQTECFIQTLNLHGFNTNLLHIILTEEIQVGGNLPCQNSKNNYRNTFLTNNTATQGADIYGGLLDRCTVGVSAEFSLSGNGLEYLNNTVLFSSIASDAVRVEFCNTIKQTIPVKKGQKFVVSVMVVDQVGNPVINATIHSSVITESGVGRLKEGQAKQTVSNQCTELEYNVFSQDSSAQVELYADGPCINLGISRQVFSVSFLTCNCPIGLKPFQPSIECKCDCDPVLRQEYQITNCFEENGTIKLESNIWIGIACNTTNGTGYIVSNCTFDYCVQKPVNISLSNPDEQCAYNRSGVLCGECKSNFSLVLGTSRCEQCSNIYLLLAIPFALAGILLVTFILVFNITIAKGTIHGLIFYTNILAANQSISIPFHNALTVFISWVNLDLGIETCFYDGMNSQAKVLLQLVFPAYLFLLMFLIIIFSKYFNSFAKLLSNRNPVAALGTLILLSYSKFLRFIISALQYRVLSHSDSMYTTKVSSNSRDLVWLYDGNVKYFTPNHIPRFFAATLILIAGGLFTVLLFFGQWFSSYSKVMKWTKNTKYIGFMDVFHAPFTPKHRYWVGLLLFALIAHNIVSAMAVDTSLPVLSCGVLSVGLIGWKLLNNRIYRDTFCDSLETLYLLNVAILAFGTSYVKETKGDQSALGNTSMALSFSLVVITLSYHFYQYVLKKSNTWPKVKDIIKSLGDFVADKRLQRANNSREMHQQVSNENDEDELLEAVDDYEQRDSEYTDGVVEEADPDCYITPPIIRPATRPDQLRLPYMDELSPLTTDDYKPAPPLPRINRHPVVTRTEVGPIHNEI